MKKSKTLLFGLIFTLTACGGGGGSGDGINFKGRKVNKEEYISLVNAAETSNPYNYATVNYTQWNYGAGKSTGTMNYYRSGTNWTKQGASSTTDFAYLLTYQTLKGSLSQIENLSSSDTCTLYAEPFGISIEMDNSGTLQTIELVFEEHGLAKEYYQSSGTSQMGVVYYQYCTVTYSVVN